MVQLYLSRVEPTHTSPIRSLKAFRRISLAAGETRRITLTVPAGELAGVGADGRRTPFSGAFEVAVGGKQPGMKGRADAATTGAIRGRVTIARRGSGAGGGRD